MEPKQYLKLVLQHWKMVVALVTLGLVIGVAVGITRPSLYQTGGKVQISFSTTNPIETPPDWGTKNDLYSTIVSSVTSDSALRSIGEKNGLPTNDLKALAKMIVVDPVEQTEYVKIVVYAPSSEQALGTAKDVIAYMQNASNQFWFEQLNAKIALMNKQLESARQNYQAATQAFNQAKQKYTDLETAAFKDLADQQDKQIQLINDKLTAAQKNLQDASNAIPRNANNIQLAKDEIDRLQNQLDQVQQSSLPSKLSDTKEAELDQQAGRTEALNRQQAASDQITYLEGMLAVADLLKTFPDMHSAAVTVVDPPLSADLQSRNIPLYTGAGLLVALLLNAILILIMDRPRLLLEKARASNRVYQQPILVSLANFKPRPPRKAALPKPSKNSAQPVAPNSAELTAPQILVEDELPEAVRETFRALANKVVKFYQPESQPTTQPHPPTRALEVSSLKAPLRLLVASGFSGVGKTLVARNVAWSLAEEGYRVLLVDADRKNATLAVSLLPKGAAVGEAKLAGAVAAGSSSQGVAVLEQIQETIYPGVDLLPASALPVTGHGQIQQRDLNLLLEKFGDRYQVIICDTPALETVATATGLVQNFPNVLFVAKCELAEARQEREYVNSLMRTGLVTRCGMVINRFE
jgi:Mrp family chromosome partitioning ATPase